ncbi:MAG: AMP-binding protein [Aquihabitans sp.]
MRGENLYHRAPYPIRMAVASGRGALLRSRRYDRDTDRLATEAIDREQWTAQQWTAWQDERVEQLVDAARVHAPAYRSLPIPAARGLKGLTELPLLRKDRLRADPRAFVRDNAPRRLASEHTSGTTATPLTLWISRPDYRSWYALSEARWRRWYGVSRHDRWAIIGGQPIVSPTAVTPPYWVWNAPMRQLYLSSYHVAERTAQAYIDAIDSHRITYLLGYPSSIHALAQACLKLGRRPKALRVVVANAEPVLPHQRAAISDVFGCPVRETYGMAEYVAAASECDQGRLHLWPEVGVLEVLDHASSEPVPPGTTGRFACTGLVNTSMPLIRYLVGDAGSLAPPEATCPCGRTLPILASVEGRCDDLVRTPDGRLIGRLDPVFKQDLPIHGAQIVQLEIDRFRILVVPAEGYGPEPEAAIARRLRDRVGDVRVEFEPVDTLPLGPNGKFKAVVSHLDAES